MSQNSGTAQQERYISGHITDAEDGNPIPDASVFLSNTTIGTTTDAEGYFIVRIPGEGLDSHGKIRNTLQGNSTRIFPDGTFTNTLSMGRVNNSASLMGLSFRLPIDYVPEVSATLATADVIAENDNVFENIAQHFETQINVFPQEKLHLHTDRDFYVPGERIRFKAYLTDAVTHQPAAHSRYVYVELISPVDTLVSRVMIRPENELFYGHLFLSEIIPEGDYTLRAYTRYMENLGDDYFFKKNIRIGNITSNKSQISQRNRTTNSDFDISFYPEGGNLLDGVWCKVAFKALNRTGCSETITGEIVDETGTVITSVQTFHAGMGVFSYVPESGKKFFLRCRNSDGLEKQFELPQPNPCAYALTASWRNEQLLIGVQQSIHAPDIPCYLLVHCRGMVLSFSTWNKENKAVIVGQDQLPAGVIQIILFDEQMNPLSERLVFNKYDAAEKLAFHTDKTVYEKRDKITATLTLSPSLLESTGMSLSVAITDDADIPVDSSTTILSSLLLSSELKGYIENPAWYLQDNVQSVIALDYLMMTHGWRRYNIPEVVRGNPEFPSIACQTSQEISGHVKSLTRSRPVAGSEVLILVNDSEFGLTSTDENGKFLFRDFEYPDSTDYFLRAVSNRGSDRVELVMDRASFPKLIHAPQSSITEIAVSQETTTGESTQNAFITKAEQRSMYDDDMRVIHLSEVEVTAPRIERKEEPRLQYWANSSSDATIRREEIERTPRTHPADYLGSISSVQVFTNTAEPWKRNIIINRGSAPLILIDGIPSESLDDLPVDAVESMDVFKGVSTTAFGVRGANGVISVTTRTGGGNRSNERNESNYTVYTPLGYQKPVEFYSPKYETLEAKHLTIPDYRTTIFWKPDVVISEDEEEASFEFYTSDFPTTYSVVIEGLTTDGQIIRQIEKIKVE